MELYDAVTARLTMLGYCAAEDDTPALEYLTDKCRAALLTDINHKELPDGLFYTLADMVAGAFLHEKLAAGTLEIEGLDFSSAKSISEGDVSITFDGADSAETRFRAQLDAMTHPSESVLGAFRRLRW